MPRAGPARGLRRRSRRARAGARAGIRRRDAGEDGPRQPRTARDATTRGDRPPAAGADGCSRVWPGRLAAADPRSARRPRLREGPARPRVLRHRPRLDRRAQGRAAHPVRRHRRRLQRGLLSAAAQRRLAGDDAARAPRHGRSAGHDADRPQRPERAAAPDRDPRRRVAADGLRPGARLGVQRRHEPGRDHGPRRHDPVQGGRELAGRGVPRSALRSPRSPRTGCSADGLRCSQTVGECVPAPNGIPTACELATGAGCNAFARRDAASPPRPGCASTRRARRTTARRAPSASPRGTRWSSPSRTRTTAATTSRRDAAHQQVHQPHRAHGEALHVPAVRERLRAGPRRAPRLGPAALLGRAGPPGADLPAGASAADRARDGTAAGASTPGSTPASTRGTDRRAGRGSRPRRSRSRSTAWSAAARSRSSRW